MSLHAMRLIFQRDVQALLGHFTNALGFRTSFLAPDGRELRVGLDRPHSRYCRLVRERLGLRDRCLACDRRNWRRAARCDRAVGYRCHAGLVDACVAIRVDGAIVGYLMMGQFRTGDAMPAALRGRWRREVGTRELERAFAGTPRVEPRKLKDVLGLFTVLANFVTSHRLVAVRGADPIRPLLDYLAQHPRETLTTGEAARLVHRSPSSLSHLFRQVAGRSFRQHQIGVKLDLADGLFQAKPEMTVREVAYSTGFEDPYYFSRLYAKHRGRPPRETLRRQRRLRGGV
jgi:AraC-like DNA-binding protein/ligand-binding sensor protein